VWRGWRLIIAGFFWLAHVDECIPHDDAMLSLAALLMLLRICTEVMGRRPLRHLPHCSCSCKNSNSSRFRH
jgi:hypothetical protein